MSLHTDLVEQARHLAFRESKKPRQASLRRAVSTAYYSLFHMLVHEAALILFPNKPAQLRQHASRAFTHAEMKNACKVFADPNGTVKNLTTNPLEPELNAIARALVELQEARHSADYDLTKTFDRVQVVVYVEKARDAMTKWKTIKNTPNAKVFLTALLIHNRWSK